MVVPAAELGTPFNEEIERLRKLVEIACAAEGCGRAQDPDRLYDAGPRYRGRALRQRQGPAAHASIRATTSPGRIRACAIDKVMKYVQHVHLRDTTKTKLQVRVGQGEVDYGKLIQQLAKVRYDRGSRFTCCRSKASTTELKCERCDSSWKACYKAVPRP